MTANLIQPLIFRDQEKDRVYTEMGYRIIRIPYFIQMTEALLKICLINKSIIIRNIHMDL